MNEDPLDVAHLLGPDGPIARRLEDFEVRSQQVQLSEAVAAALDARHHLIAEAGTGTGKSFAYLLPAALYADRHKGDGPVVISTRTIALQEQLEHKDLPFLHAVLPFEWSSVTAIGRNNYLCLRRMHQAERERHLFEDPERHDQLRRIVDWSLTARDGTRHELDVPVRSEVWDEVQAEHGNCLQRACKHFDRCYWQRARRRMQTAQVLIVNHALYFADLALRIAGASYLPAHRVVIFDEAHHLEHTATESLGLRLSPTSVAWHLRRIHKRRGDRTLLARYGSPTAQVLWEEAQQQSNAFFGELEARLATAPTGDGLGLKEQEIPDTLSPILRALSGEIANAALRVDQVDAQMELTARANGLDALCATLRALCVHNPAAETPLVRWLERSRRGPQLCGAPLDVSHALRKNLFGGGVTAVLTSATLGTGDDEFSWLQKQLGIDNAATLRAGSPFDYDRAVEFVVEEAMPDPAKDPAAYRQQVATRTERQVLDNGGCALILCTSWEFVRFLAQRLRQPLAYQGIELLVQGEAPLTRLLEQKREDPTSVLIGTDSLWEGIDVRGPALTMVVVTRLPFASPGHPLTKARMEAMKARGQDPFREHSLPEAILKFRQGFGRLIRTGQDRGKVVLMDPRARTKAYGRQFLSALPFSDDYRAG